MSTSGASSTPSEPSQTQPSPIPRHHNANHSTHPVHHNLHNHHNPNQTSHPHNNAVSSTFQSYDHHLHLSNASHTSSSHGLQVGTPTLSSQRVHGKNQPITPKFTSSFGRGVAGMIGGGHLVQQSPSTRPPHHPHIDDIPHLHLTGDTLSSTSKSSRGSNKRMYGRSLGISGSYAQAMMDHESGSSHSRSSHRKGKHHPDFGPKDNLHLSVTTDYTHGTGDDDLHLNPLANSTNSYGDLDPEKPRSVRFSRNNEVANVIAEGERISIQKHSHGGLDPTATIRSALTEDESTSSLDILDSDEEPQDDSGIPFSNNGHLKYPISEHLRYEYIRNDAYHYPKLPFLSIPMVERMNIVSEQERWLKTHQMKEMIAQHTAIANEQLSAADPTLSTTAADPENPSPTNLLPLPNIPQKKQKKTTVPANLVTTSNAKEGLDEPYDPHNPVHNPIISQCDDDLARSQSICDWYSRSEIFAQIELGLPLILSFSASYGVGLINLSYQGHLSEQALAAAALSLFYMNVTGLSILYGLNSGIDTLGSQMFGSQQYKMVGLISMRGAIIGALASIIVAACWYLAHHPLLLMGVEDAVAVLAQEYCTVCIWSLPGLLLLDILRRFLEVQQITVPSMCINLIGLVLVAPLNSYFMYTLDWGFIGPAYTYIIINYAMFFTLLVYVWASGIWRISVPAPSFAIFRNWGQYLAVALPAVGTIAGEWLAFELQQVIAARLGTPALAAQSLVTSINAFIYNVPMSIGISACARIGCFLGARKTSAALLAYFSALRITWVSQLLVAGTLWLFNNQIIGIFTDVKSVATMAQSVMPLLSIFSIVDGYQGMLQGVLRGFGAQSYAFALNMVWFWAIALPLSVGIALHAGTHEYDENIGPEPGLGLIGIWMSLLVGSSGVMISYLIYLGFTNWSKQTEIIYQSLLEEQTDFEMHHETEEGVVNFGSNRGGNASSGLSDFGSSSTSINSSSPVFSTQSDPYIDEDPILAKMSGAIFTNDQLAEFDNRSAQYVGRNRGSGSKMASRSPKKSPSSFFKQNALNEQLLAAENGHNYGSLDTSGIQRGEVGYLAPYSPQDTHHNHAPIPASNVPLSSTYHPSADSNQNDVVTIGSHISGQAGSKLYNHNNKPSSKKVGTSSTTTTTLKTPDIYDNDNVHDDGADLLVSQQRSEM